jgi:chemotaxis signal transduction protein
MSYHSQTVNLDSTIEGVLNLRGQIVTIGSLRKRLGKEAKKNDESTRVIVIELEDTIVGITVDSVRTQQVKIMKRLSQILFQDRGAWNLYIHELHH